MPEPSAVVHATNWMLDLGESGTTRPQVFVCDDGTERVLKIPRVGTADATVLTAEWIGALLAVELEVLTPRPALVELSEEAIGTAPPSVRQRAEAGLVFGTEYLSNAKPILGPTGLTGCHNHVGLLSRLVVLDTWIETLDRMQPNYGRNLIVNVERRQETLMAIDFGMSFAPVLFTLVGAVPEFSVISVVARPEARPLLDAGIISATLGYVETLSEADITKIVRSTPDAWPMTRRRERWSGSYLSGSRFCVRRCRPNSVQSYECLLRLCNRSLRRRPGTRGGGECCGHRHLPGRGSAHRGRCSGHVTTQIDVAGLQPVCLPRFHR